MLPKQERLQKEYPKRSNDNSREEEARSSIYDRLRRLPKPESVQDVQSDLQAVGFKEEVNTPLLFAILKDKPQSEYSDFMKEVEKTKCIKTINAPCSSEFFDEKFAVAYHEAGHALMLALTSEDRTIDCISITQSESRSGFMRPSQDTVISLLTPDNESLDFYRRSVKSDLMMYLSGGIGACILRGERLSADEFIDKGMLMGTGSIDYEGSDLERFQRLAEDFLRSQEYRDSYKDDIKAMFVEVYEEAYDVLDAHRDKLDDLAQKIYKEDGLDGTSAYEVMDIEKPNFYMKRWSLFLNQFKK